MRTRLKKACLAAGALVIGLLATSAQASTVAYDFASAPTTTDQHLSLGFWFTPNVSVSVSSLGYFDAGQDGFQTPHEVGIFDSSGALVASTLLSDGVADTLVGNFRYRAIAPVTLFAGQSYTLAATTGGPLDPWAYGAPGSSITGFSAHTDISIAPGAGRYFYQGDDNLRLPTNGFGYTIYAGPNFQMTAVPIPAAVFLLGSGLLAVFGYRRPRLNLGVLFTGQDRS